MKVGGKSCFPLFLLSFISNTNISRM